LAPSPRWADTIGQEGRREGDRLDVPGCLGVITDDKHAVKIADAHGFPS